MVCSTAPIAGHRQVGLEVLLRVPAEGADAIAGADAEPGQRRGEPLARARRPRRSGRGARLALASVTTSLSP